MNAIEKTCTMPGCTERGGIHRFCGSDRPVVRCMLLCVYCAHQFERDFTREDNFSPFFPGVIPCPIASIEVPRVTERHTWYGRRITSVVSERIRVKCPRCGSSCGLVSRQPVAA